MNHSDGGKGSGRRQEDVKKIHDNWDLIFKPKKEQPMIDDDGMDPKRSEDLEEQSDDWCCEMCGGPATPLRAAYVLSVLTSPPKPIRPT